MARWLDCCQSIVGRNSRDRSQNLVMFGILVVLLVLIVGMFPSLGIPIPHRVPAELPNDPDELAIYSIDGPARFDHQVVDQLYGFPVLGKVEVKDPVQRRDLVADIKWAMWLPKNQARCFVPRHLIRTKKDGKTVDTLICFQCGKYSAYLDGLELTDRGTEAIAAWPQAKLDKILTDAGVPLPKKDWP
jgi:hypothetical protein